MTAFDVIFIEENLDFKASFDLFLHANQISEEETNYSEDTIHYAYVEWDTYATIKIYANQGIHTFMAQKYLNFPASTALSFTPLKERTRSTVQTALLRIALVIVRQYQWKVGIMLENLEEAVLLYQDGMLKIREHEFWTPERLRMLAMPFSEENLYSAHDANLSEDM